MDEGGKVRWAAPRAALLVAAAAAVAVLFPLPSGGGELAPSNLTALAAISSAAAADAVSLLSSVPSATVTLTGHCRMTRDTVTLSRREVVRGSTAAGVEALAAGDAALAELLRSAVASADAEPREHRSVRPAVGHRVVAAARDGLYDVRLDTARRVRQVEWLNVAAAAAAAAAAAVVASAALFFVPRAARAARVALAAAVAAAVAAEWAAPFDRSLVAEVLDDAAAAGRRLSPQGVFISDPDAIAVVAGERVQRYLAERSRVGLLHDGGFKIRVSRTVRAPVAAIRDHVAELRRWGMHADAELLERADEIGESRAGVLVNRVPSGKAITLAVVAKEPGGYTNVLTVQAQQTKAASLAKIGANALLGSSLLPFWASAGLGVRAWGEAAEEVDEEVVAGMVLHYLSKQGRCEVRRDGTFRISN